MGCRVFVLQGPLAKEGISKETAAKAADTKEQVEEEVLGVEWGGGHSSINF